jgi:hypothetical protein
MLPCKAFWVSDIPRVKESYPGAHDITTLAEEKSAEQRPGLRRFAKKNQLGPLQVDQTLNQLGLFVCQEKPTHGQ